MPLCWWLAYRILPSFSTICVMRPTRSIFAPGITLSDTPRMNASPGAIARKTSRMYASNSASVITSCSRITDGTPPQMMTSLPQRVRLCERDGHHRRGGEAFGHVEAGVSHLPQDQLRVVVGVIGEQFAAGVEQRRDLPVVRRDVALEQLRRRHLRVEVDAVQDQPRRRVEHDRPHARHSTCSITRIRCSTWCGDRPAGRRQRDSRQAQQEVVERAIANADHRVAVVADLLLVGQVVVVDRIEVGVLGDVFLTPVVGDALDRCSIGRPLSA